MGFYRGPNIVTNGLTFAIDSGSGRSYPRLTPPAVWYDYSGGLAAGYYTIENSIQPYTIRLNTSFASWVGYYQVTVPSAEKYTLMFDYVADASSQLVIDNDGVDDNNWNATISVTTTVQTYNVTKAVTTTGIIKFFTRRVNGGNITISNFRFFKTSPVLDLIGSTNGAVLNGVEFKTTNGGFFDFDGVDDRITLTSDITLGNGNLAWTASAWVKTTNTVNGLGAGCVITNDNSSPVFSMMGVNSGKMVYWTYSGGWNQNLGVATVTDGNWHLLTWVNYTNITMDMYVDGALDKNVTSAASGGNNRVDAIGNSWNAFFDGQIAPVHIYNGKSLTAAEVLQNYNAQKSRFI